MKSFLDSKLDVQFKSFQSVVKGSKLLNEILSKQRLIPSNSGLGAGLSKQVHLAKGKGQIHEEQKDVDADNHQRKEVEAKVESNSLKRVATLSLQPDRLNFSKGDFHQLPIRLSHREGIILFLMAIVSSAIIMAIR